MMEVLRRESGRSRRVGLAVCAIALPLALAALLAPDPAAASNPVLVFQNDHGDGSDHGIAPLFPDTTTTLDLYMYGGPNFVCAEPAGNVGSVCRGDSDCDTSPGDGVCGRSGKTPGQPSDPGASICRPGSPVADGDEICGVNVRIEVIGDAVITAFYVNGDIPELVVTGIPPMGTSLLHLVFVRAGNPLLPAGGPHKLGTLTVERGTGGATVSVTGIDGLGANFSRQAIVQSVIAVPEPGQWLLLGSGILGLAGLNLWRRRH